MVQTRWLDGAAYASIVVLEEHEDLAPVAPELDRNRALQLLSRASRERRKRNPTPVKGQLALLRVA
jgi:hypothetical protein